MKRKLSLSVASVLAGDSAWTVEHTDCLALLRSLPDECVDSIVTDPPSGIGFMSKAWDSNKGGRKKWIAWLTKIMKEALRVLKPGGHALVWALPRTSHWTATALEDAGFEIRDVIHHLFGCLSEDTEILVDGNWVHYSQATAGRAALCYDSTNGQFSWQPIRELFAYEYSDTAYRIHSDHTDQIVSRGHRCLVEQGGSYVFQVAETLEREARVPILEDLPGLLATLRVPNEGASNPEQVLREDLCRCRDQQVSPGSISDTARHLPGMRSEFQAQEQRARAEHEVLFESLPRPGSSQECCGNSAHAQHRAFRPPSLDEGFRCGTSSSDVRGEQPCLARRCDVQAPEGQLHRGEVREMPAGAGFDGGQERLCRRASNGGRETNRQVPNAHRGCAPQGSQSAQQRAREPNAVRDERGPQVVRGARHAVADLAVVEPIDYSGIVWCVSVPTGAFVARRNGKVFVTGNSGMPKNQDASKAIDIKNGDKGKRPVVGSYMAGGNAGTSTAEKNGTYAVGAKNSEAVELKRTIGATEQSRAWDGWGTALRPAAENWILARKPLIGILADNLIQHGTGALNIDANRIPRNYDAEPDRPESWRKSGHSAKPDAEKIAAPPGIGIDLHPGGGWPANVVFSHDSQCGEECVAGCPVALLGDQSGELGISSGTQRQGGGSWYGTGTKPNGEGPVGFGDAGGASRFFNVLHHDPDLDTDPFIYQAKPSTAERELGCDAFKLKTASELVEREEGSVGIKNGRAGAGRSSEGRRNNHPTLKSIALMRLLTRAITRKGGVCLDLFTGSGTTGMACVIEGFRFIGAELNDSTEEPFASIARARITHVSGGIYLPREELRAEKLPTQKNLFEVSA